MSPELIPEDNSYRTKTKTVAGYPVGITSYRLADLAGTDPRRCDCLDISCPLSTGTDRAFRLRAERIRALVSHEVS
jgi:hypothetical protein